MERTTGFTDCSLADRLLYTAFLLLMGGSFVMALVYLYLSHEGHDGKPGVSIEDIVYNYYGNRTGTRLEAAIRGTMAPYIAVEDRNHVIEWIKSGATEKDYQARIQPIFEKSCVTCHGPSLGLKVVDLTNFAGAQSVANIDTGASVLSLVRLSHIHLFGIGIISFGIGLVFRFVVMPQWLKAALSVAPFAAVFVDIASWFLTKWDPVYAYTVVAAGVVLGLTWATQILIALYQLWVPQRPVTRG